MMASGWSGFVDENGESCPSQDCSSLAMVGRERGIHVQYRIFLAFEGNIGRQRFWSGETARQLPDSSQTAPPSTQTKAGIRTLAVIIPPRTRH